MKILKLTVVALMAIFMGMNFASCSDDNDEPSVNPEDANGLVGTKWDWATPNSEYMQVHNIEFIDAERCIIHVNYYDGEYRLELSTYTFDEELDMGMILWNPTTEMLTFTIDGNKISVNGEYYNKISTYKAPSKTNEYVGTVWYAPWGGGDFMQFEFIDDQRCIESFKDGVDEAEYVWDYYITADGNIRIPFEGTDATAKFEEDKMFLYESDGSLIGAFDRKK
ncbi:MAG: hypothetical protein J6B30_08295 [Muribaculaceae bacterium]|nr:hypothetical protein [Muribaculaceae bacterium]